MKAFDPYYKWLGIPPNEQPPNHYRLLGLRDCEPDPDVIDAAADRQMTYVQQCATGPNLEHSQKLLNELAAARICLLDSKQKEAYDRKLKAEQAKKQAASQAQAASRSVPSSPSGTGREEPVAAPIIQLTEAPSATSLIRRGRKSSPWPHALLLFAGVLFVAGVVWFFTRPPQDSAVAINEPQQPETPENSPSESPAPPSPSTPVEAPQIAESAATDNAPDSIGDNEPTVARNSDPPNAPVESEASTSRGTDPPATADSPAEPQPNEDSVAAAEFGEPVDLLKLIDLQRDTLSGEWKFDGPVLVSPPSGQPAQLQLPLTVPSSYSLTVIAERILENGKHDFLNVGLVSGSAQFSAVLDVEGQVGGLSMLDGKFPHYNETRLPQQQFHGGKPSIVVYTVNEPSVKVQVNGRVVIDWKGDFQRLSLSRTWKPTNGKRLFLGANSSYRISKWELRRLKSAGPADSQADVYLSQLTPAAVEARVGPTWRSETVVAGGIKSPHGIWLAPYDDYRPSWIVYGLNRRFRWFQGAAAIADTASQGSATPITFRILGDDKELWRSKPLQKKGESQQFGIDVSGVDRLKLETTSASIRFSHSAWFEPRLLTRIQADAPKLVMGSAIPDEAAQQQAEATIRELYAAEIDKAKSVPEKMALAQKLFDAAGRTAGDSAGQFVLLRTARDLWIEAGDVRSAIQAVDEMARFFSFDVLAMKAEALKQITTSRTNPELTQPAAFRAAAKVIDEALAADNYQAAEELAGIASTAATRSKLAPMRAELKELRDEIAAAKQAWETAEQARTVLEQSPDDPQANETLGKYLCFTKRNWDEGLPHLDRASDPKLKAAAELELARPITPDQQTAAGDAWTEAARSPAGRTERGCHLRAAHWYRQAQPLLKGLQKVQMEQKIEEVLRVAPRPKLPRGAVLLLSFDSGSGLRIGGKAYIRDQSGYDNYALVAGPVPTEGRSGAGLAFDGSDDYLDCANSDSLTLPEAMSVSAWIKARSYGTDGMILSKDDWKSGSRGFVLRVRNNGLADFTVAGTRPEWSWALSKSAIDTQKWYHLAGVFDGKMVTLFVNGERQASNVVSGVYQPSTFNLRIGRGTFDAFRRFDGVIDEVAIFPRALAEDEVLSLYQLGLKGTSK